MTDRRYTDHEVAEIFRRATLVRPESRVPATSGDGMTLAQLEAVAEEAGIEPARIAAAARELDAPSVITRRAVGVPVSVSRSVELPRRITDAEWEFLVTRLRETFDAAGKLESHGTLRQWSNGNLRVYLEPGIAGHRVRFTSMNSGMRMRLLGGAIAGFGGMGLAFLGAIIPTDALLAAIPLSLITGVMGLGVAASASRLTKNWRDERRGQFEALAAELERLSARS